MIVAQFKNSVQELADEQMTLILRCAQRQVCPRNRGLQIFEKLTQLDVSNRSLQPLQCTEGKTRPLGVDSRHGTKRLLGNSRHYF